MHHITGTGFESLSSATRLDRSVKGLDMFSPMRLSNDFIGQRIVSISQLGECRLACNVWYSAAGIDIVMIPPGDGVLRLTPSIWNCVGPDGNIDWGWQW